MTATTRVREISIKTILSLLALGIVGYALSKIPVAIFILLISGLLAAALHPFISWLTAKKIPKRISIAGVFALFIIFLCVLLFSLGTIIVNQGQQLILHFPQYVDMASDRIKDIPFLSHQGDIIKNASAQLNGAVAQSSGILLSSLGYIFGVLASVFSIFTILIFTYFFLAEADYFHTTVYQALPLAQRDKIMQVLRDIINQVGAYVRGQLIVVSITGLFVGIALTFLDVPFSYIQGLLVAVLDIIPVIGPLIALTIGVIITVGAKLSLVPWVIVIYLLAQQLENGLVFPYIMNRSLNLHGFWILLSIFLLSALIGPAGVILAVPTAIIVRVLIKNYYLDPLHAPAPLKQTTKMESD